MSKKKKIIQKKIQKFRIATLPVVCDDVADGLRSYPCMVLLSDCQKSYCVRKHSGNKPSKNRDGIKVCFPISVDRFLVITKEGILQSGNAFNPFFVSHVCVSGL